MTTVKKNADKIDDDNDAATVIIIHGVSTYRNI